MQKIDEEIEQLFARELKKRPPNHSKKHPATIHAGSNSLNVVIGGDINFMRSHPILLICSVLTICAVIAIFLSR